MKCNDDLYSLCLPTSTSLLHFITLLDSMCEGVNYMLMVSLLILILLLEGLKISEETMCLFHVFEAYRGVRLH